MPRLPSACAFIVVFMVAVQATRAAPTSQSTSQPASDQPTRARRPATRPIGPDLKTSLCAGTVRDDAGKPVPNATIFVFGSYSGGIREVETVTKATCDADGRYDVRVPPKFPPVSAVVVAVAPAHPPAISWRMLPIRPAPGAAAPETLDFVLARKGAGADVKVFRDAKPLANAAVQLRIEDVALHDHWVGEVADPLRDEFNATFRPVARTGDDGVAHFDALLPGVYTVIAVADADDLNAVGEHRMVFDQPLPPLGRATGVPLRAGSRTPFSVAINATPIEAAFSLRQQDGRPLSGNDLLLIWTAVDGDQGLYDRANVERDGAYVRPFPFVGLFRVGFAHRADLPGAVPVPLPFWGGEAIVGASPRLGRTPVTLTAARITGGRLRVHVTDGDGRATADAAVELMGRTRHAASTDGNGDVTLDRIGEGDYWLRATIPGMPSLSFERRAEPFPDDAALMGRVMAVPRRMHVGLTDRIDVTLRTVPVGYIRGTLKPPEGTKPSQFWPYLDSVQQESGVEIGYHPESGDFLAGPFAAGRATVDVVYLRSRDDSIPCLSTEVDVVAGKVTRVDLTPAVPPAEAQTLFGIFGWPVGSVTLADGNTPANGAVVSVYRPGFRQAIASGVVDAAGRIQPNKFWHISEAARLEAPGSPRTIVAVATLPGTTGAVVTPLSDADVSTRKPLMLSLPPAVSLRGAVTIAGKPPRDVPSYLRILARHQGNGSLDRAISVETSADAEGRYELVGLAPGRYLLQASLDNIWLSPSRELVVADGKPIDNVDLDIPAPGGPVEVQVIDRAGQPAACVHVTLARPAGPLTDALWPADLESDRAGILHVPPLEAGDHRLTAEGSTLTLTIPALADKRAPTTQPTLRLQTPRGD